MLEGRIVPGLYKTLMADGILTQITMAGGAINLVFNTIIRSGDDNNPSGGYEGPSAGQLLIFYYNLSNHMIQPVMFTYEQYNALASRRGSSAYTDVNFYFLNSNNVISSARCMRVYGYQYSDIAWRRHFSPECYFMIVGNS